MKKLLIGGDSSFAEVAWELFSRDSDYEVVGFFVEGQFLRRHSLLGLPVIALETMEDAFSPESHCFYVAVVYTQLNRLRTRLYLDTKNKGYTPASYLSSRAFVMPSAKIGEHTFIFEGNVIQSFATVADNVVMWSGNHLGHHSIIEENCFISSHVTIAGHVRIGKNSFLGINSSINDQLDVGEDSLIGAGSAVNKNIKANSVVSPVRLRLTEGARAFFKVAEDNR